MNFCETTQWSGLESRYVRCSLLILLIILPVAISLSDDDTGKNDSSDSQDLSCVPLSFIHSLREGGNEYQRIYNRLPGETSEDKCREISKTYGKLRSRHFPEKPLLFDSLVQNEDIGDFVNAVLANHGRLSLNSRFLDKQSGESGIEQLRRVHGYLLSSIKKGIPPIASFRSIGAVPISQMGNRHGWLGIQGHAVAIIDVPQVLFAHQEGFIFEYLEGVHGERKQGYLFIEKHRDFTVITGNGRPPSVDFAFLNVIAPSMPLSIQNLEWKERAVVVMMLIVGDF
jgi:hypothetical protein